MNIYVEYNLIFVRALRYNIGTFILIVFAL